MRCGGAGATPFVGNLNIRIAAVTCAVIRPQIARPTRKLNVGYLPHVWLLFLQLPCLRRVPLSISLVCDFCWGLSRATPGSRVTP